MARAIWNDRRAALCGVFPLIFLLVICFQARSSISSLMAGVSPEVADAAREEILKGVSLGFGAYVSAVAALYLSFNGVRRFFAIGAESQPSNHPNRGHA